VDVIPPAFHKSRSHQRGLDRGVQPGRALSQRIAVCSSTCRRRIHDRSSVVFREQSLRRGIRPDYRRTFSRDS